MTTLSRNLLRTRGFHVLKMLAEVALYFISTLRSHLDRSSIPLFMIFPHKQGIDGLIGQMLGCVRINTLRDRQVVHRLAGMRHIWPDAIPSHQQRLR